MSWRNALLWVGLALALIVANLGIAGREKLLREGRTVLLELAPVDPRSLMQGDYMALNFAITADVHAALGESTLSHGHADGYAILARADNGTTSFVRAQAQPIPVADGEIALRYRLRGGELRIVTNAWFFPEGQAERYQPARYGELRVGSDGEALLVVMRDADLEPL
jgi:uncharacterized membrane-anchored protein